MTRRIVIARVPLRDGKADEAIAAFTEGVAGTRDEEGVNIYRLHRDQADPNVLWFYEEYETEDAYHDHMNGPVLEGLRSKLGGLLAGAPEAHILDLIAERTPIGEI